MNAMLESGRHKDFAVDLVLGTGAQRARIFRSVSFISWLRMSKLGVHSHKALESFLDGYLKTAIPVEETPEPVMKVETCLNCNDVQVKITCASAGCKKKRTKECATE